MPQMALSTWDGSDASAAAQSKTRAALGAEILPAQAETRDHASLSAAGSREAQGRDDSDVRLGKVAKLRQAIADGSYNVPASAVADKIVEALLR